MTDHTSGDGPQVEITPIAAWRLTPDLKLEAELDVRRCRLEGLERRADGNESP